MKNAIPVFLFLLLSVIMSCQKEEISLCEEDDICQVSLYPIPTSGKLTLKLQSDIETNVDISVWSLSGQRLISVQEKVFRRTNEIILNLSTLDDGVYLLSVEAEGSETAIKKKIIKQTPP